MLGVHLLPDILQARHTNYHAIFALSADLGYWISDHRPQNSNLECRIPNLKYPIGPRILDLEFRITNIHKFTQISDLESRVSNLSVVKCSLIYLWFHTCFHTQLINRHIQTLNRQILLCRYVGFVLPSSLQLSKNTHSESRCAWPRCSFIRNTKVSSKKVIM